jgi:hypothetical protein
MPKMIDVEMNDMILEMIDLGMIATKKNDGILGMMELEMDGETVVSNVLQAQSILIATFQALRTEGTVLLPETRAKEVEIGIVIVVPGKIVKERRSENALVHGREIAVVEGIVVVIRRETVGKGGGAKVGMGMRGGIGRRGTGVGAETEIGIGIVTVIVIVSGIVVVRGIVNEIVVIGKGVEVVIEIGIRREKGREVGVGIVGGRVDGMIGGSQGGRID